MSDSEIISELTAQNSKLLELNSKMLYMLSESMNKKIKSHTPDGDVMLSAEDARKLLGIKCNKTLNRYRNKGLITATSPYPRNFRYSQKSILVFLSTLKK